jgi:hypothetical protein
VGSQGLWSLSTQNMASKNLSNGMSPTNAV